MGVWGGTEGRSRELWRGRVRGAGVGKGVYSYRRGPSIVPVESCPLSAIMPVKSLGADGNNQ